MPSFTALASALQCQTFLLQTDRPPDCCLVLTDRPGLGRNVPCSSRVILVAFPSSLGRCRKMDENNTYRRVLENPHPFYDTPEGHNQRNTPVCSESADHDKASTGKQHVV
ncbi:hypothetical protein ACOMHN_064205 [Nucella lapillus]